MNLDTLIGLGVIIVSVVAVIGGLLIMVKTFYKKVEQGKALIVNTTKSEPTVTFTGALVLPVIHRHEEMDISLKTIEIDRRGKEGLICQDNIRADIKVTFFVRVNKTETDVLKVAQSIGCKRASDPDTLENLFNAKFSEALKGVGKGMEFEQLYTQRKQFRDDIMESIGDDLNGYALEDAAIDYLEQTPIEALDKDNILDAQGIEKITRLTAVQSVITNQHQNEERRKIKDQDVRAEKDILTLEREKAEAEEQQKREIAISKAKNEAETRTYQAEQLRNAEESRIKATREVAMLEEQKQRDIELENAKRQGALNVENERLLKETEMENIRREREVTLQRFAKDKDVEKEKKDIAEVRRQRIAVEKGTVEEEERIKDTVAFKEADREKQVRITTAEGAAQESLVKEIKAAEASGEVAKFDAKKRLVLAEAALEAADKEAKAKQRMAEGVQAEVAAPGLAEARVKEVTASAIEKEGLAEAKVIKEKMIAEAHGQEEQGMARARVTEAHAGAIEKEGLAEAKVIKEKMHAEASGKQEQGLAQVRIQDAEADIIAKRGAAEADAIEKKGMAEASAVEKKLVAEATGLAEKANAMKALDGVGREHEEFRIKLQTMQSIEMERISVQRHVAEAQARVMGEAFKTADINIVGGDGEFFQNFMKAVTLGKSVDGFVENSDIAQNLLGDYLSGDANLPADIKDILTRPALGTGDVQNLTVAALIGKLATGASDDKKAKLMALANKAKELGLDSLLSE